MSDAMVQLGMQWKIAFGSFAYTGYLPEDGVTWKKPRNIQEITDENDAIITKLISQPKDSFSLPLLIKDTGGDITPPVIGSTVTITDPDNSSQACMVEDATVEFSRGITKLTLELVNEPDITYS